MNGLKVLLLGGSHYLIPVIERCHELGIQVFTADNIPFNPAHEVADESFNISIVNKEEIIQLARKLNINGVLSFATDPGVISAAFVAQELKLPSPVSYDVACMLQDKSLFRLFLMKNGFNTPKCMEFNSPDEATLILNQNMFSDHVIIKPVDSAGSKGISLLSKIHPSRYPGCHSAAQKALRLSLSHRGVIEDYILKTGFSSDSDCFFVDGELKFCSFSSQLFDKNAPNPFVPAGYIWRSALPEKTKKSFKADIQRLANLCNVQSGLFNIELLSDIHGKLYIMEMSPRGGGNRISEALRIATSYDLIDCEIKRCLNLPFCVPVGPASYRPTAVVIIHSNIPGKLKDISYNPAIEHRIINTSLRVSLGEHIESFYAANKSIGTIILDLKDFKIGNKEVDAIQLADFIINNTYKLDVESD